jgi:hypothetical protein
MKEKRIDELGRDRMARVSKADVFNGTVIGILTLWVVWASTSLLIHFVR